MRNENQNASRSLSARFELPSWELLVLILFAVTVLGLALRSPMKSFPNLASQSKLRQLDRDPYDLQSERSFNDSRNRVETGL
jgi:hypothetical protein